MNSWRRGTFLRIQAGWDGQGRKGVCLGPSIQLNCSNIWWTPVLWDDEEDPDWQKAGSLEKVPPKGHRKPAE